MVHRRKSSCVLVKTAIKVLFKIALAGGLFYWLLSSGRLDLSDLGEVWRKWYWLLTAQVLFGLVQVLMSWRWQILLEVQGIRYSLGSMLSLTLIGLFFNQVAFGSTGGDVYRAYVVARGSPGNRSGAVASVLVDRVMGLYFCLVLIVVAAAANVHLLAEHLEVAWIFGIAASLCLLTVVLLATYRRWTAAGFGVWRLFARLPFEEVRSRFALAIRVYGSHRRPMIVAALLSFVIQILIVGKNICLALALLDGFDIWPFFILVPAAHLVMAVPINPPGALGTAEAVYAYLFELIHISVGGLLALLQRASIILWSLAGAIIFVCRKDWPALNREVQA